MVAEISAEPFCMLDFMIALVMSFALVALMGLFGNNRVVEDVLAFLQFFLFMNGFCIKSPVQPHF